MWKEYIGVVVSEKEGVVHGIKHVTILNSENCKLLLSVSPLDLTLLYNTPFRKQSATWCMPSDISFK